MVGVGKRLPLQTRARANATVGEGTRLASELHTPKAFTLPELLIVIAVISLLASLLLPVLSRVNTVADSTVCIGNLRQMGLGLAMYLEPSGKYPGVLFPSPNGWISALEQFTTRAPVSDSTDSDQAPLLPTVFACPAYVKLPAIFGDQVAYGYNCAGVSGPWGTEPVFGQPPRNGQLGLAGEIIQQPAVDSSSVRVVEESEVTIPSGMIALADSILANWVESRGAKAQIGGIPDLSWGISVPDTAAPEWMRGPIRKRHNGIWNVMFCDGHVTGLPTRKLFDFRDDEVRRLWNKDHLPHRELQPPYPPAPSNDPSR
jgi:prepilin-type N-terminal cleavage/methylation domain-containing protein/prepilin-type processing-associated H-X9-DG protein